MRTNNQTLHNKATAAAVTLTVPKAGKDRRLRLLMIAATVSAGSAVLTVTQKANTADFSGDTDDVILELDVAPGAPVNLNPGAFGGLQSPGSGRDIEVSLSSAGGGNVGRLTVTYTPE